MTPDPTPQPAHDHGAAGFCVGRVQASDEPRVWCETCQHIHIASIPEITYACHRCGFGSWHSETATEHESLCPGHETYSLDHVTRPIVDPAPDERTETVARVLRDRVNLDAGRYEGCEAQLDEVILASHTINERILRIEGSPEVIAAAVVAALDDESARLRASADAWWSEYDRELKAHEATKAEVERLTRIVNGYDRTPAEQRAADAEAERDAARAALDRVRALDRYDPPPPPGTASIADLRAALDPEESR